MSLEGILASCMKAEKIASGSQRKYSWERGPDREGNEDGVRSLSNWKCVLREVDSGDMGIRC